MNVPRTALLTAVLFLITFLITTSAAAISVSIANVSPTRGLDNLSAGNEVTIDIVHSNADGDPVAGLDIEAFGWNTSVLRISNVEVTDSVFNEALIPTPSGVVSIGGLSNVANKPFDQTGGDPGYHQILNAISITPTMGTGGNDVGISGGLISEGDVHARVSFVVLCGGSTTIQVRGLAARGDVEVLVFEGPPRTVVARDTNVARVDLVIGVLTPPPHDPPEVVEPDPPVDDPPLPAPPTDEPAVTAPPAEEPPVMVDLTPLLEMRPGAIGPTVYSTTGLPSTMTPTDSFSGLVVPEPTTATLCLIGLVLLAIRPAAPSQGD